MSLVKRVLPVHGSVTQEAQQCGTVLHQGSTHAHLNDRSLRTHPGRWSSAFVDISGRRKRSVLLKDLSFEAAELLHQNSNPKGKGIYPCRGCGKVYRWYQNLVVHQRIECGSAQIHLNDRSFRSHPGRWSSAFVDVAGRRQRSVLLKDLDFEAAKLLYQDNNRKGAGLYPCRRCGKVYRWYRNLSVHQKLECGKEPQFHCPYCIVRTTQKSSLIRHIRQRHSESQQQMINSDIEFS
ncbi:zinc finger protein 836-like [Schistocerca serialis cubense]|uniref:zinc finger protein 836-like n=1 Tax=Schistocerca serialis cubense TaxID=2023355 RepID=UPI00214E8E87|nr:zinc finger protein 836-like [Schistocerca serialis cubense]